MYQIVASAVVEVTAHFAPHAGLYTDPNGGPLPAVVSESDECPTRIQGNRGQGWNGDGPAMYPKGFDVGPTYSPMTYVTGECEDGASATHEQLEAVAKKVLGEGARRRWLYRGMSGGKTTWWQAWVAAYLQADPVHGYEFPTGAAGRRLAALLVKATGGEHLDMGHHYGAVVLVGA